ncbi:MAG: RteC domain-containing protein [Paludibacter sp.]|nr:RteC domain-containing protein [Paludibacter sp.]
MNDFITKLNKDLSSRLQDIDLEEPDLIRKTQKSIRCTKDALTQLRAFTIQHTFCNDAEEILFFKKIKPELFSKLIYYVKILNIESRRPVGNREIQKTYLQQELEKLTFFFNNHLEFYQYYRMNSTYLDDKYFIRGKEDLNLYQDTLMSYIDPDFSTSHDYMVSKIIANDRLKVFLSIEIEALSIKAVK